MIKFVFSLIILLLSTNAWAIRGLNVLNKEFSNIESGSSKTVVNMPRVLSQDEAGICYAFTAKVLFDHANCVSRGIKECAADSNDKTASVLDIVRFRSDLVEQYNEEIKRKNVERKKKGLPPLEPIKADDIDQTDRFNYEGLSLDSGGDTAYALQNMLKVGSVAKESCAPFDQMVSQLQDPYQAKAVNDKMWADFKKQFEAVRSGKLDANQATKRLKADYCLKTPEADILAAFGEEAYDKFLDKLLVPDQCWDIKNSTSLKGDWGMDIFPRKDTPKGDRNYKNALNKIKGSLGSGQPVGIQFCSEEPLKTKNIKGCAQGFGHSVVISGYQRMCDAKNVCKDVVKVQNSWGKSWQEQNNDGWVDAKVLLDRTFYEPQSLVWLRQAQ